LAFISGTLHIDLIIDVLVWSRKGGDRRIIINLPPGFMKSLLVLILYVAWRLGVNPAEKIICISYGDDLTHNLSRKTRELMLSPLYRVIFWHGPRQKAPKIRSRLPKAVSATLRR
jgi:hypothetical protein